ncbi:MAG: hypothetical protein SGPRY_009634 [Prymnesium sp.]
MSFCCFVPGHPMVTASSFTQVAPTRWSVLLESPRPIDEIAAFISEPLPAGMALGCHVASAPFEVWHYLGAISSTQPRRELPALLIRATPSEHHPRSRQHRGPPLLLFRGGVCVVFKTRFVWSARDAVPTSVTFGVELQQISALSQAPPEKASTPSWSHT